jgi:plastocyanin
MMRNLLFFALILTASASAPDGAWAQPATVGVELSNFKFNPAAIQLSAGAPTTLHLQNASGGGHNFSAPEFFAAAKIDPRSAALVRRGTVEVPGHGAVDVSLVPAAGTYKLKCSHAFHSTFGMTGTITVR